jgi:hypothetical protein
LAALLCAEAGAARQQKGKDLEIFHTPLLPPNPLHFTSLHLVTKIPIKNRFLFLFLFYYYYFATN